MTMANFCEKCGAKLDKNAKFCASCGAPVNNRPSAPVQAPRCAYCGAELKATSKFCLKCGKPVAAASQPLHHTESTVNQEQSAVQKPKAPQCPYCGAELKPSSKFCMKCGKTLTPPAGTPEMPDRRNVQPNQPPAGQYVPPVQQAAQNAAGRIAQPIRQALGNTFSAMPTPGEAAFNLPDMSGVLNAVPAAGSGGLPGFVVPLIAGAASGGVSIPLLYQLPSPWPLIVGLLISGLTVGASFVVKKLRGGNRK